MTAPVTTEPATDVPDTEQPADWHAHRYLTAHGHTTGPCDAHCCTKPEES